MIFHFNGNTIEFCPLIILKDPYILRRGKLQGQDFLNNHFGGKRESRRNCNTSFIQNNLKVGEQKFSFACCITEKIPEPRNQPTKFA